MMKSGELNKPDYRKCLEINKKAWAMCPDFLIFPFSTSFVLEFQYLFITADDKTSVRKFSILFASFC